MSELIKKIDTSLLKSVTEEARKSQRLRMNFNLHDSLDDPCQRLLNAIEPGTYVRPHRHSDPPKSEAFIALCGRMSLLVFDDQGNITDSLLLAPGEGLVGAEVPPGIWHSIVSHESGSVFFEVKHGPYHPLTDKDFASWAPVEGGPSADDYLESLVLRIAQPTCAAQTDGKRKKK